MKGLNLGQTVNMKNWGEEDSAGKFLEGKVIKSKGWSIILDKDLGLFNLWDGAKQREVESRDNFHVGKRKAGESTSDLSFSVASQPWRTS